MSNGQKGGWLLGIVSAVVVALIAGANRPWWLGGGPETSAAKPAPIREGSVAGSGVAPAVPASGSQPLPAQDALSVVLPDFMVGRWRVEQSDGVAHSSTMMTYYSNGRCDGHGEAVRGYTAQPVDLSGTWHAQKISARMFHLEWQFDNGTASTANFKVLDKDHIQNLDVNYVAERVD